MSAPRLDRCSHKWDTSYCITFGREKNLYTSELLSIIVYYWVLYPSKVRCSQVNSLMSTETIHALLHCCLQKVYTSYCTAVHRNCTQVTTLLFTEIVHRCLQNVYTGYCTAVHRNCTQVTTLLFTEIVHRCLQNVYTGYCTAVHRNCIQVTASLFTESLHKLLQRCSQKLYTRYCTAVHQYQVTKQASNMES